MTSMEHILLVIFISLSTVCNLRGQRKSHFCVYTFQLHCICTSTSFSNYHTLFQDKHENDGGEKWSLWYFCISFSSSIHTHKIFSIPSHHQNISLLWLILSLQIPFLESSSLLLFEPIFWKYPYTLSSRVQLFSLSFYHHLILHRGLVWHLLYAKLYV